MVNLPPGYTVLTLADTAKHPTFGSIRDDFLTLSSIYTLPLSSIEYIL